MGLNLIAHGLNLLLLLAPYCLLQHLCRTFTVLAEIFAEVVAGFIKVTVRVVKSWQALKR